MIKNEIKNAIASISQRKKVFAFADVFKKVKNKTSRQYASTMLHQLVNNRELIKVGSGRWTRYALPKNSVLLENKIGKRFQNHGLEEDKIFQLFEKEVLFWPRLKESVQSLVRYGFMEMVNNAIEHSDSKTIAVTLEKSDNNLIFTVSDFGIGVFRNIMQKRKLNSELEAIQDLLKGKTTTAPKAHSGEGIFFTSKSADIFTLESFGLRLRIDNTLEDTFVEETLRSRPGTRVSFMIDANSKRHLNKVFEKYQTQPEEYAFDKTEIKVKLYILGTIYISRSQARRILAGLNKFKSIILDFDQVPTVGQAFADEIFRVFKNRHPEIKIEAINMKPAVEFMVKRVNEI